MKVINTAYSKKEFIATIEKTMKDGDVIVLSTAIQEVNSSSKKKLFSMKAEFSHEIIKNAEDIRSWVNGNITGAIIIFKDYKAEFSEEWVDGLKKGDGVFGFSIQRYFF